MFTDDRITTAMVKTVFAEEIAALDGKVSDTFDDGERLFVRSILPGVEEVRAKDCVEGGVALRMSGGEAWVHPYVVRQVCSNGAIMAQAIETRHVADFNVRGPAAVFVHMASVPSEWLVADFPHGLEIYPSRRLLVPPWPQS